MRTRSLALALTLIHFACSSTHQIGTGPVDQGTSGTSGTTSAPGGTDVGTGGGSSTGGLSATGGTLSPSGGSNAPGPVSESGGAAGDNAGAAGGEGPVNFVDDPLLPKRVVFFYTPLGTVLDSFRPANTDFSLAGILQPLEAVKEHVLVVDGIDNLSAPGVPTSTPESGASMLLRGRDPGGRSLDIALGTKLGTTASFQSMQLGVQSQGTVTYLGPTPAVPSGSPGTTATLLFGGAHPEIAAKYSNSSDFQTAGKEQLDLIHDAIQFDRCRVFTLSWGDLSGAVQFSWVPGVDKTYGALASSSGTAGPDRDHFVAVQTWLAQEFAYLVSSLAKTPEGSGTLLDHTLLVWVSETGEASVHTGQSVPVVLAGNLGRRFRNGAYVKTSGSQASLLATIASGAGLSSFGDPALGNTPIAALLAP